MDPSRERAIRSAAFRWLRERDARRSGIYEWSELTQGFVFEGERITLIGQTGIWFPQGFSIPISITTNAKGTYGLDDIGDDGILVYAYRGSDREHRDNRGLQHPELLDAAHIIADAESTGLPIVPNGLSLCKIHHAAFDQDILGVSPDYLVHIRHDILEERDGPMLKHGLQEPDGTKIILPARTVDRPDRERLAVRFDRFRRAS